MLKPKSLDDASELLKLDGIMVSLRQQAETADADPFDDTLAAALKSAADAIKAEGAALEADFWPGKGPTMSLASAPFGSLQDHSGRGTRIARNDCPSRR